MVTKIQLQTGPSVLSDGSWGNARGGKSGEVVVQQLHGRYFESCYRQKLFTAYAAAVATSVVGTGMVGLQLWNGSSTSSGVLLVLHKVGGHIVATSATTTALVLATGAGQVTAPTGQTAATRVANSYLGSAGPNATALNAGTFTNAPTALATLMHNTAAIATTGEDPGFLVDFEGSIIIPPQYYVCIAAVGGAVAASGSNLFMMWEEVPV